MCCFNVAAVVVLVAGSPASELTILKDSFCGVSSARQFKRAADISNTAHPGYYRQYYSGKLFLLPEGPPVGISARSQRYGYLY